MGKQEYQEIYNTFLSYFKVEEIVSPTFYNTYKGLGKYGILSRFDIRLLTTMIVLRETLDSPITINDWIWGGKFDERGYRDLSTDMVKDRVNAGKTWGSPHLFGAAFDFDVEGMTANEVREWLKDNMEILPHPIRLERKLNSKYISWVHLDICYDPKNPLVYEFDI